MTARIVGHITMREMAEACGLSEAHFARAFRQSTGVSPHQWLMRQRIERSKELLADGRKELSAVAMTCGFSDQSHFTRAFTRFVGTPPGTWRRCREVVTHHNPLGETPMLTIADPRAEGTPDKAVMSGMSGAQAAERRT